jgi:hypothetical protein
VDVEIVAMFSLTIDEMPEMIARQAAIHEVRIPSVDVRSMLGLLERLGLTERLDRLSWERDLNWVTASDAQTTLSINELSGGLRYRLRPLADEPGTEVNGSASRLEEIARGFLDRLGRPSEPLRLERITYLRTQSADANGSVSTPATLDAGLVFTRTVDDLPVVGPGGVAMVKIGTDEAVVGGREIWRPISQRGSKVPLRTPEEAINLLRARLKQSGLDGEIHVRKARLGYAELGIEESQRYLEPCYAFVVETIGGLVDSKKIEVIPAARIGPMASTFTLA